MWRRKRTLGLRKKNADHASPPPSGGGELAGADPEEKFSGDTKLEWGPLCYKFKYF
jgi:hypothetical protein